MLKVAHVTSTWVWRLKAVLIQSLISWVDQRAASKGAALAFYTLFSMTPILMLSIAVAGYFFGAEAAQGEIVSQLARLVGPNGALAIQAVLAATKDTTSGLVATLVAAGLLLVGTTSVFVELKGSLDELWGVDRQCQSVFRDLVRTRLLSFGIVLVLAFLLLVSLVVSAALAMLERYVDGAWSGSVAALATISSVISFAVNSCMFAVIYKTLPAAPLSWSDVAVGAIFTAVLFSLGKFAIGVYLGNSGIASGFGAAGSLIALLLWVYYSAQIFFLGAEFTRHYALNLGSLQKSPLHLAETACAT